MLHRVGGVEIDIHVIYPPQHLLYVVHAGWTVQVPLAVEAVAASGGTLAILQWQF